ncbi:asparaginase [Paenibacillus sp. IB182496]|uniref:asparaginase n=1 Tax=Paenibacillus sabuli TaxID=2772509 RepID=A0A927BTZ1_9BACL|nr:asparaginase [Paenibacillus sabuli]MBD2846761.1 asparaginase [Paenibacillus sabuli]
MTHILLAVTGGTIGSHTDNGITAVSSGAASGLLERYRVCKGARNVRFDSITPFSMLSENLLPTDWLALRQAIIEAGGLERDGIIVTHGTDTLPFTAAALSYLFHDVSIPIVLVASNSPLHEPRSAGLANFRHAVDFVADSQLPGVYVSFADAAGRACIHLGTRLHESAPFTDEFVSAYGVPLGVMDKRKFRPFRAAANPTFAELRLPRIRHVRIAEQPGFSDAIRFVKPYPGLDYRSVSLDGPHKPHAVLHQLYHSATACMRAGVGSARYALLELLERCRAADIPLFVCPVKSDADSAYETNAQLLEAGAVPLRGITTEAALVKLMLAYGTYSASHDIVRWLTTTPLFFDTMQPRKEERP